jgi:YkoY family integral membrane protein
MLDFLDETYKQFLASQTFERFDLLILAVVVLTEILLSADNILIMGVAIKKLPLHRRDQMIWAGVVVSVVLRIVAILLASYLIRYYLFQGVGGLYLMYLAAKQLKEHNTLTHPHLTDHSFLRILMYIILVDLLFSIDSILTAFAIVGISPVDGEESPKLWIVLVGASLGICVLRSTLSKIIYWLERKPILEKFTLIFVLWIGLRLLIESVLSSLKIDFDFDVTLAREMVKWIFWSVTLLFFTYAGLELVRDTKKK